jgi:hypothetical protein
MMQLGLSGPLHDLDDDSKELLRSSFQSNPQWASKVGGLFG